MQEKTLIPIKKKNTDILGVHMGEHDKPEIEHKISKYYHRLSLARTVAPYLTIILQLIILAHIMGWNIPFITH